MGLLIRTRRTGTGQARFAVFGAVVVMLSVMPASAVLAATSSTVVRASCLDALATTSTLIDRTISLAGNAETRVELPSAARGTDALVYAVERGIDVVLEARDSSGVVLALADNPVARSGTQRMWLAASARAPAQLVLRGREHAGVTGSVRILVLAAGRASEADRASCVALERTFAAADLAYGTARATAAGTHASLKTAASSYEKSAAAYASASRVSERGEAELALAALNYYDLQEWTAAAKLAEIAASTLDSAGNSYAHARAQAILAAAWLEIGRASCRERV